MIPKEALEAAARAMVGEREWPDHSETWRKDYLEDMRAALEAAAPHLMAEAWDQGYTTGNAHNGRRDANPYRKRPDAV